MRWAWFVALCFVSAPLAAQAPDTSLIPVPRPGEVLDATGPPSLPADTLDRTAVEPNPEDRRFGALSSLAVDPAPPVAVLTPGADTARPVGRPVPGWIPRPLQRPSGTPQLRATLAGDAVPVRSGDGADSGPASYEIAIGGLFAGGEAVVEVPAFADDTALAVIASPRPETRPDGLADRLRAAVARATPARVTEIGQRGELCGRPGIVGDRLTPIIGRIAGCGIPEPVRVRVVDGITLSTPATVNCDTARALQDWLGSATDIVGRTGGGIDSIRVVASYSCRTRNNQPGARLSEHSTGSGIDIAGIGLVSGQEISLLGGWRDPVEGPILRRLHQAACGPFGTVLGPESDRFHQDHFHFDVADYRSGPYCR